jgi:radical SAM superfamily enzyme YgiQ (UPF0313 family)
VSAKSKVAIITGIPPISLAGLGEKGVASAILPRLFSMLGKDKFHFSVPTIGPATIASYLQQNDIETVIFDYYQDKMQVQDCDIVGISSTFTEAEEIKKIANDIKSQNISAPIVLGGPLSWLMSPVKLLESIPEINYIVQQEGEETFLELIKAIRINQAISDIEGIIYRDKEKETIEATSPRKHIDFEKLPYPAWEIMRIPSEKRIPVLFIETSRGCPYQCAYCSEVTFWGKPVRYRSSQRVTDEIRHNIEKFGITTFRFTDSCLSYPPKRCGNICDAIIDQCINDSLPVKWSAYARIEDLSPELIDKMKRSGCVALDIGLESGSPEVLRRMNKNYNPEVAVSVAKIAKEAGIIINYNIMIGFPGETKETIKESMDLIERAAPDTYSCFLFLLRPNSTIYDHKQDFGIKGEGSSWKHTTMTSDEARVAQLKFTKEISSSTPFPGGEHFACYFSSLGYSTDKIRDCFKALLRVKRNPLDIPALLKLRGAVKTIAAFS